MSKISFELKFLFDEGDQEKAVRLHKLLKKYGVVKNIVRPKEYGINKDDRLRGILNSMIPGEVYTSGQLWRRYKSLTGYKTFQRDLNTLIIQGRVQGILLRQTKDNRGRTRLWTRMDYDKYSQDGKEV